jgi:hypothetical protein
MRAEPRYGANEPSAPDQTLARLIEILAGAPGFRRESARQLLLDRIDYHLGRQTYINDHDLRFQWFAALVYELAATPGGCAALLRAIDDLAPRSQLRDDVAALVATLTPAPGNTATRGGGTVPAAVPGGPAPAGREPRPGHGDTRSERLSAAEIRELALVFGWSLGATQLLREAGVSAERLPPPGGDAITSWTAVADLLGNGLLADGRRRVLAAAAHRYPVNPVFAAARP